MRRLLFVSILVACETYVPPPTVVVMGLTDGVYNPDSGALAVSLVKDLDLTTMEVSLVVDRRGTEGDLCLGPGALPKGCAGEASPVLSHCRADPAKAERTEEGARYACSGGAILVTSDGTALRFIPETHLIPYERYLIRFEPGLADAAGHRHGVPVDLSFHMAGDLVRAPTDLKSGVFFAFVETQVPIPALLQFWFYVAVRPETGELRIFGTDVDPVDMSVDPKTNRIPRDWKLDPNPPTGSTLRASGQVADTPDGRVLHVYPFLMKTVVPPVEVVGMEVAGRFRVGKLPGAPDEDRELLDASMTAPAVFLGLDNERAALGAGRGVFTMMRLTTDETPALPAMLPTGVPASDILDPFAGN